MMEEFMRINFTIYYNQGIGVIFTLKTVLKECKFPPKRFRKNQYRKETSSFAMIKNLTICQNWMKAETKQNFQKIEHMNPTNLTYQKLQRNYIVSLQSHRISSGRAALNTRIE